MDLINDLTCPVCLELFTHPVILPCSHVLCRRPCAENIFEVSFIRCPVCRETCNINGGINSLPRVITIENITEKVKEELMQAEKNKTKAATDLASNVTNDNVPCKIFESSCTCSPIRSLIYSSASSIAGFDVREAELKYTNQNVSTKKNMNPCKECVKDVIYSSASETRMASKCDVYRSSVSSSSEMKFASLTSSFRSANNNTRYHSQEYCADHTTSINACADLKRQLQEQLRKLSDAQRQLLDTVTSYWKHVEEIKNILERRQSDVNDVECDSLVAEIEKTRTSYPEYTHTTDVQTSLVLEDASAISEELLVCSQQLSSLVQHVLEDEEMALIQVAPILLNSQPIIDVLRSTRSNNSVALVISHPPCCDVIHSYEIMYFSEEQKHEKFKKHQHAKWPINLVSVSRKVTFVLIEGLSDGSHYYFSACAVNRAGRSPFSDYVHCRTLSRHHCVIPIPVIMKNLCKTSATSTTIMCPSPTFVTRSQGVTHFLLQRQDGGDDVWQGEEMLEAEKHQVDKLEPDTGYQFVVLGCSLRGECQISEKINLKTWSEQRTDLLS